MLSFSENLQIYLADKTKANAHRLFKAVSALPGFARPTPWLRHADRLGLQQRWDEIIRIIDFAMPGAVLSPAAHSVLSQAYSGLGRAKQALAEAQMYDLSIEVIFKTGEGTKESPWQVLHVADEYLVLQQLNLSATQVVTLTAGENPIDLIETSVGKSCYFQLF